MKRIVFPAVLLCLCSCQTVPDSTATKDYAALAGPEVSRYTITDNNVDGFEPEGRFDPSLPIRETSKDGAWTVHTVAPKRSGFDRAEVTVDEAGTIIRLRFFKASRTALGWKDSYDSTYQELKSKYKAVQRIGDKDMAELTVYVAADEAEWKQHYIQYLQLMDEPNNLGAQNCWILHPHLSLIQATIQRQGEGGQLVIDYQTKKYADALKIRAALPKRPADRR
jgi:hypothetical protein